jgi:hypothetical protein
LKKILQQTSWAGWQHSGDKWSEAVSDPLPFTGLESYQTWWWTHLTKKLPLRFLTMHGAVSKEITEIIWICNVWFVSVLSWFVFCSRLLFVDNFWSQLATIWHFWLAPKTHSVYMCTWYLQQTKSSNCHLMVFNKLSPFC